MTREESKLKTITKRSFTFSDYWDRYSTITILAIMVVVFGILRPTTFLTGGNLVKVMEQSSITILLGLGEFFAILLGGIDLSVSSIMALSGALTAQLMVNAGFHPVVAILVGVLLFGAFIGFLNGVLVTATGLPPSSSRWAPRPSCAALSTSSPTRAPSPACPPPSPRRWAASCSASSRFPSSWRSSPRRCSPS